MKNGNLNCKVNEIAIHMARMWGIMETLDKMPECSAREFTQYIDDWTEEFVSEKKDNLVDFFQYKMEEINHAEK